MFAADLAALLAAALAPYLAPPAGPILAAAPAVPAAVTPAAPAADLPATIHTALYPLSDLLPPGSAAADRDRLAGAVVAGLPAEALAAGELRAFAFDPLSHTLTVRGSSAIHGAVVRVLDVRHRAAGGAGPRPKPVTLGIAAPPAAETLSFDFGGEEFDDEDIELFQVGLQR